MLLRVRAPSGQARVTVSPDEDISSLCEKISISLKITNGLFSLAKDPAGVVPLKYGNNSKVSSLGVSHGDMIFVIVDKVTNAEANEVQKTVRNLKQPDIDDYMEKQNGLIKRGFDKTFCRHGPSGMCDYCMPLEPYDPSYLEKNKIKHLSFHSYLRQLLAQSKSPGFGHHNFIPPLDEISLAVKSPCPSKSHDPYPLGICTKCQPSAISLQSQPFRMIDHVEFETHQLVERLLEFWRQTGFQRFAYLYGRVEEYKEVPLGLKVVVVEMYEPKQIGSFDGIQLLPDDREREVDDIAKRLGLEKVGMIYTDLVDDGSGTGSVICKRHIDSYFLSSAEIMFIANKQRQHPNPTKYSSSNYFGSRFVTCVISGNTEGAIDVSAFQVSNTGVAMVRDGIVEATVEPSKLRVKESSGGVYVPEVFYKYKNEYGILVSEAARPTFPVDYLIVTLSHGFPQQPNPTFPVGTFPPAHREQLGIEQTLGMLKQSFDQNMETAIREFHILLFLSSQHVLEPNDFELMIENARLKTPETYQKVLSNSSFQTLLTIIQESVHHAASVGASAGGSGSVSTSSKGSPWQCVHCTYLNLKGSECEMCGLPKE